MTGSVDLYRRANVAIILVLLIAPAGSAMVNPTSVGDRLVVRGVGWQFPEICLVKRITGQACASCGLTRSVVLAAHLRIEDSLRYHPGGLVVWAWLLAAFIVRLILLVRPIPLRLCWLDLAGMSFSFLATCATVRLLRI